MERDALDDELDVLEAVEELLAAIVRRPSWSREELVELVQVSRGQKPTTE